MYYRTQFSQADISDQIPYKILEGELKKTVLKTKSPVIKAKCNCDLVLSAFLKSIFLKASLSLNYVSQNQKL